jgi:hypothetical protein
MVPRESAIEDKMRHLMRTTGVASAFCFALFSGPPTAVAARVLEADALIVIPVMDQEDLAVEEDLRPDEVPDDLKDDDAPKMDAESSEADDEDTEDEMIDKIGPGAE